MTVEELLIPRFKVIADYPTMDRNGNYMVGDILTDNGKTAVLKQNGDAVFVCEWKKYPHLFKKLEWWEERNIEDMPKYILGQNRGDWHYVKTAVWIMGGSSYPETTVDGITYYAPYATPLTEEEFKDNTLNPRVISDIVPVETQLDYSNLKWVNDIATKH
jgi:hypothetical protein